MDGFSVLIAIAAFVLGLVALHKMSRLETRVAQLRMQIDQLLAEAGRTRHGGPARDCRGCWP